MPVGIEHGSGASESPETWMIQQLANDFGQLLIHHTTPLGQYVNSYPVHQPTQFRTGQPTLPTHLFAED